MGRRSVASMSSSIGGAGASRKSCSSHRGKSAPNKRNQFGFVVTGPVFIPKLYNGKDKTFFMFSWEWQRQRNGATSTALVPTPAERSGDFSLE